MPKTPSLIQLTVLPEEHNERLDLYLVRHLKETRADVQRAIASDRVQVNGKPPKKAGDRLRTGGVVIVLPPKKEESKAELAMTDPQKPVEVDVPILLETDDFIVIDKPAGLLVHPTEKGESETVSAWLVARHPGVLKVGDSKERPGIVHRLDKDASGVMVVAKTKKGFAHLKKQFQDRTVEKIYTVLTHENVLRDHGTIDFLIDRGTDGRMVARPKTDPESVRKVQFLMPGKEALTEFWVTERFTRFTLLKVQIHTGRTHQIRVHFFAYSHPLVGDTLYVNPKLNLKRDKTLGRLFLHATSLTFTDMKGERVTVEAPLPKQLSDFLITLR